MFVHGTSKDAGRAGALRRLAKATILPCALAVMSAACGGPPDGDELLPPTPGPNGGGVGVEPVAQVASVFVRDGGVYVGGTMYGPSQGSPDALPYATIWHNGEIHRRIPESGYIATAKDPQRPDKCHYVHSPVLTKDGGAYALVDVDVNYRSSEAYPYDYLRDRCYRYNAAAYWKDGEVVFLDVPRGDAARAAARSIFVSDANDVYIAGRVKAPERGGEYAVLWKNGAPSYLSDGARCARPASIFVSGGDVYVAGVETDEVLLWDSGIHGDYVWAIE